MLEKVTPRNLACLVYVRGWDFSSSKNKGMASTSLRIAGFLCIAKTWVFWGSNLIRLVLVQLLR